MKVEKGTIKISFEREEREILDDAALIIYDILEVMRSSECDQIEVTEVGNHHVNWVSSVYDFLDCLGGDEPEIF